MVSNPKSRPENDECRLWLVGLIATGTRVVIPEIADYEVRRELVRASKAQGIDRLDLLKRSLDYLPITTEAMLLAADLWGNIRRAGLTTAADHSLDGDVILAAQALTSGFAVTDIVVSTTNVGHLSRLVRATHWRETV
jgi:predicted nucleic acid-binding protein